jgi:hypothetical protein
MAISLTRRGTFRSSGEVTGSRRRDIDGGETCLKVVPWAGDPQPVLLRHVGTAPVDSDDQAALAKQHRGPTHSVISDPAFAG